MNSEEQTLIDGLFSRLQQAETDRRRRQLGPLIAAGLVGIQIQCAGRQRNSILVLGRNADGKIGIGTVNSGSTVQYKAAHNFCRTGTPDIGRGASTIRRKFTGRKLKAVSCPWEDSGRACRRMIYSP